VVHLPIKVFVGHCLADQPPLDGDGGGDAFGEHGHPGGTGQPDHGRDEGGGAAIWHQADVGEGEKEVGGLAGNGEVGSERERTANSDGRPVNGSQYRLADLS
jgi:hypothetical protein